MLELRLVMPQLHAGGGGEDKTKAPSKINARKEKLRPALTQRAEDNMAQIDISKGKYQEGATMWSRMNPVLASNVTLRITWPFCEALRTTWAVVNIALTFA